MIYKTFPTVDKVFLTALRERYPNVCPKGDEYDFFRKQGEQTVLEFLEHQYKQQNLNLLES